MSSEFVRDFLDVGRGASGLVRLRLPLDVSLTFEDGRLGSDPRRDVLFDKETLELDLWDELDPEASFFRFDLVCLPF